MSAPRLPRRAMHLISARGGGSARFARDLVDRAEGHLLLHAGADTWVVEAPAAGAPATFHPYSLPEADSGDWLQALLDAHGADLLHVHFVHASTLAVLEAWCQSRRPWAISLHDVGFLRADAFDGDQALPSPDPPWVARWRPLIATAALITLPSRFLADLFAGAYPGLPARVIAPGVDGLRRIGSTAPARPHVVADDIEGAADEPGFGQPPPAAACHEDAAPARQDRSDDTRLTIGIVGALGPHKGKERLLRWLRHGDARRFRWVLIGYTDDQLHSGWLGDRLWVHGPFLPEDTAHWLEHYGVDLVLFPNRVAESFSYALSDVWAAVVPVLVPAVGALGERVASHGGGALLGDPDDVDAVFGALNGLARADAGAPAAAERAGSDDWRCAVDWLSTWRRQIQRRRLQMVPGIAQMVAQMTKAYATLPPGKVAAPATVAGPAEQYLRAQLDERVFRHENIRLARDYAQVRAWSDKLGRDVARMQEDLAALGATRAQLDRALSGRDADIAALRARNDGVEQALAALKSRNLEVEGAAAALAADLISERARGAELRAREAHLIAQLAEQCRQRLQLAETSASQAVELTVMHQRINALVAEIRPLRIKGARYDRVRGWLPRWLLRCLRLGRSWLRAHGAQRNPA